MASVSSSLNPGVADLLQTLSNLGSPTLNSSAVKSALEKAPASDIVQLSSEATQLQNVDAMFGIGTTPTSDMSTLLASLEGASSEGTSSTTSTANSTANESPAEQAATAQATAQMELTQGLFGTGTNTSFPGTLFSSFG
jgi:hypothetical protein